ncbi:hypothetical protein HPB49_007745 [Dermacentor silvarum]|uniref:Uncharacterized protein n=1 Tax=Dermacentor silvarum TaxID=543639 RepID=A0ACB8CE04_DERSI|nr:hypothetical protein HPB49_007745 [Dermacentor silvarum]
MMTPPISNELLISLVQFEPALWDQRSDMYRRNDARLNGWKRVVKALGLVVSQENINLIVRRWRNLRDTFGKKVKELRKKSGAGAGEPASKWKYFDMLLFLRDIVEPRPVDSQLREEKLDRTEQFLLSLAEHMDNVPIRLRAQCKCQASRKLQLALLQALPKLRLLEDSAIALLAIGANVHDHKLVVTIDYGKENDGVRAL